MGSLKAHVRLPIGRQSTPAQNCLVFEKIAFLYFGVNIQDGGFPLY